MKHSTLFGEGKVLFFLFLVLLFGGSLQACSDDETPLTLEISDEELVFGSDASSKKIEIKSSAVWEAKVVSGADWCSYKDETNGVVSITVKANDSGAKRESKILFTCGTLKKVLLVIQENIEPMLEITETELSFDVASGSKEIQVQSNIQWKAGVTTAGASWVTCVVKKEKPNILVIAVESNSAMHQRKAIVSVTAGSLKKEISVIQAPYVPSVLYSRIEPNFDFSLLEDDFGNTLPDFSNIGYKGGEVEIPEAPVVKVLSAPMQGVDATSMIQNAIDEVSRMPLTDNIRGAILLQKGQYEVFGSLAIKASGVVLRGEGDGEDGTILVAAGKKAGYDAHHRLIKIAGSGKLTPSAPSSNNIKEAYVPVGRFWVTVNNPGSFQVGDDVTIYRPGTDKWIHDLKMDQIEGGSGVKQWEASGYNFAYERVVTKIIDDTLHFDNPIMMAMETRYGGGAVYKSTFSGRINHCGVENMQIISEYDKTKKDKTGYYNDEDHSCTAIDMTKTEHSWIRNVTSKYFAYGLAELRDNSRYITVKDCKCFDGVAVRTGGRLYSFLMDDVSSCLVIDCETTEGRHDCVTGSKGVGPNAFVRVKIRNSHADAGPHHRWNIGTLYDNIDSDGQINVQDRADMGSGHGWAGANQFLWNCKGGRITVQNPWVSAKNFSIGTKGNKHEGARKGRPDGVWIMQGKDVTPVSLYDAQLALRKQDGRLYHTGK